MKRLEPHIRTSKHSQTLLINQLCNAREKNGETIFKFGFGQSPFPVPDETDFDGAAVLGAPDPWPNLPKIKQGISAISHWLQEL